MAAVRHQRDRHATLNRSISAAMVNEPADLGQVHRDAGVGAVPDVVRVGAHDTGYPRAAFRLSLLSQRPYVSGASSTKEPSFTESTNGLLHCIPANRQ